MKSLSFQQCILCLLLMLPVLRADPNLLVGDTDAFPGTYQVHFVRGTPTESGRIQPPWVARFPETRGEARLTFAPDPLRQRPAFGLINLSDPRALVLTTERPVPLIPGTRYVLRFDLLTQGGTHGSLRLANATRRLIPLHDTRGVWITQQEVFTAGSDALEMSFANAGLGEDQGLFISRLRLVPEGTPDERTADHRAGSQPLPGFYGELQQAFGAYGRLSFLNGSTPGDVLQTANGGTLLENQSGPFPEMRRFEVTQAGISPQAVRLQIVNREPVLAGEQLVLLFFARGRRLPPQPAADGRPPELHTAIIGPNDMQRNQERSWLWAQAGPFPLRENWQQISLPLGNHPLTETVPPGELRFEIWLGHQVQQVDIAQMALMTFSDPQPGLEQAFRHQLHHGGGGEDAAWRTEAAARIRTHRQSRVSLQLFDPAGDPLPHTEVRVEMQRHAFHFGTRIDAATWLGRTAPGQPADPESTQAYRSRSMAYFNRVVLSDQVLPWPNQPNALPQDQLQQILKYYTDRNVRIGITGLFPPPPGTAPPAFTEALPGSLTAMLNTRVPPAAAAVSDWTVLRETAGNASLFATHGLQLPETALTTLHQLAPEAKLWWEEADFRDAIVQGAFSQLGIAPNHGWIGWAKDENLPLHGLSVQAANGILHHLSPEQWWRILDVFTERFALPVRFTGLHVPLPGPRSAANSPEAQAAQLAQFRDTLLTLFAHPAVEGIDLTGFWAGAHPFPSSALWDREWQTTPIGDLYLRLVFQEWWNRETHTTDAEGRLTLPLFLGTHQLRIPHQGEEIRRMIEVETSEHQFEIRL